MADIFEVFRCLKQRNLAILVWYLNTVDLCDGHGLPATLCPGLPHYVGVGLTKSDLAKSQ